VTGDFIVRSNLEAQIAIAVLALSLAAPAAAASKRTKAATSQELREGAPGRLHSDSSIAIIDGQPILYSEIEKVIGLEVRKAEAEYLEKVYELRRGALDQLVMSRLLDDEAKKAGKTTGQWMEEFLREVPELTDEQLHKAFEENAAQLDGATFEQSKDRLREHVRRNEGQKRFAAHVEGLTAKRDVKVLLVPPEPLRLPVAATGPSRGSDEAKVTIVEFSDFQCPYCSRARGTLARLLEEYKGKVRLVYRHFPLAIHAEAEKAAEASLCAQDQGKFWELHDRMFAEQDKLSVGDLKAAAKDLGLGATTFDACLDEGTKSAAVAADVRAAREVGVQGAPAFFVNGALISGAAPYEQFKAFVDREIERM
jgi:protein-disulfide isomerase